MESHGSSSTVGIDLGTTRSVVAQVDQFGRPRTLLNSEGDLATPSAVLFEESGIVVGREALRALVDSPNSVAQYAKRELGNPNFSVTFRGVSYPPEMIQSFVLGKLRRDAELSLGHPVQGAVITVPAFFDEPKRRATMDAGLLAGIEVKAIINEPTAAAIAFGASNGLLDDRGAFATPQTMLVFDLGGGTFDVSLLKIDGKDINVVAVDGNARLGGLDWDKCIVKWLMEAFQSEHHLGSETLEAARTALMSEAEQIKHALSARRLVKSRVRVSGVGISSVLTRERFEELTEHLLDRTRFTARKLLSDCGMSWADVDRVLLVGGSTRMPQVAEMLEFESGMTADRSLSPDEAVAHGAAVYAGLVLKDGRPADDDEPSITVSDVNAHHLGVVGVEPDTGRPVRKIMIAKNTPLPARKASRFQTVRENQKNVMVRVVEGGDARGHNATEIGKLVVDDLPPDLPSGSPIDVYFRYDRDGLIKVDVKVPSSSRRASIRIDRSSGLSENELDEWRDKNKEIYDALGLDPE